MNELENKYFKRGVSSSKDDLHKSIAKVNAERVGMPNNFNIGAHAATKGAFATGMKIPHSIFNNISTASNRDDLVFFLHADGAGSKPALAYLFWKETGKLDGFYAVSEDALVMNSDDLLASGVTNGFYFSSLLSRNAKRIPGEVLHAIMDANAAFVEKLHDWKIEAVMCGGETADVGDSVSTLLVDAVAAAFGKKEEVINASNLSGNGYIVGLASYGKANYESVYNSGIAANGLTSARHDLLSSYYKQNYPETCNALVEEQLNYCGKFRLLDELPMRYSSNENYSCKVWQALLSPTRTFLPIVKKLTDEKLLSEVLAIFHNTGGGLTKCLRFGVGVHYEKHNLLPIPPVFEQLSQYNSGRDMLQTFNCGTRLELLVRNEALAKEIISVSQSFGVDACIIGEFSQKKKGNSLRIKTSFAGKLVDESFSI